MSSCFDMSDGTRPGAMALTVMLSLASSAASFRVRWCTAAFLWGGGGGYNIVVQLSIQASEREILVAGECGDWMLYIFGIGSRECALVNLK